MENISCNESVAKRVP